jgi:hypothetical protein
LLAGFSSVIVRAAGIDFHHFWRFGSLLKGLSRNDLEKGFGNAGWYLVVTAKK